MQKRQMKIIFLKNIRNRSAVLFKKAGILHIFQPHIHHISLIVHSIFFRLIEHHLLLMLPDSLRFLYPFHKSQQLRVNVQ